MARQAIDYVGSPPTFRISFFTAQQGDLLGGWSENFWSQAASFSIAKAEADDLYDKLLGCKDSGVWMPNYRISSIANSRQVYKRKFGRNPGTLTPTPLGAAVPTVKALIFLPNSSAIYTTQWLGGLSTVNFQLGQWVPSPSVTPRIGALYASLSNNSWVIRKVAPGNMPKLGQFTITIAGVCTYAGHGLVTGQYVYIGKFEAASGVNGVWSVTVTGADTFTLDKVPNGVFPVAPVASKGSYWKRYQYQCYPITNPKDLLVPPGNNGVIRATEHRIGRPFGQYSGRRKKGKR